MSIDNKSAKHVELCSKPKEQKDIDRLETMFTLVKQTARQAQVAMLSCEPIDGRTEIIPGVYMVIAGEPQRFQGLRMCRHCMDDAALSLRDLADLIDDMVKTAATHEVSK